MKKVLNKLAQMQKDLDAPKGQYNKFSDFWYRNAEDILIGLKPLLGDAVLTIDDDISQIGDRFYVKSTVRLIVEDEEISVNGFAREPLKYPKQSESQTTGTSSSYARKRALTGLFICDDEKDPDFYDNSGNNNQQNNNQRNNNQRNNNQRNQQNNNKKNDYYSKTLRELIFLITDSYKDKTKISIICQMLGINDISQIANYDNQKKKDAIEYLKNKFKINSNTRTA